MLSNTAMIWTLKHKLTVATHSNSFYLFVLKMLNKFLTTSKYMYITLKGNMKNLTTVKFSLDHLWISKPQNWIEQFFLMKFMIYLEIFFFSIFLPIFFIIIIIWNWYKLAQENLPRIVNKDVMTSLPTHYTCMVEINHAAGSPICWSDSMIVEKLWFILSC